MERRLARLLCAPGADRTGASREAAALHAGAACGTAQMRGAGRDIVSRPGEGADRAGRKTRAREAGVAWTRRWLDWRYGEPFGEGQRAAKPTPQSIGRMDQQAER